MTPFKLIECPRDAMQGLHDFIPTQTKIRYLNQLLQVGFDTLDFGSFVSPRAIPQLQDTAAVLAGLDLAATRTRLLAIVANLRGAEEACAYPQISYVGFPLSVSEEFQRRNTNKSIAEALTEVAAIQQRCLAAGKTLVVYLSMGFGNPYGEPYSPEKVLDLTEKLAALRVEIIAPSDTVGTASPDGIRQLFGRLLPAFPHIEFGAHLHATPDQLQARVAAVLESGVRRIDGTLRGFGGCPMARNDLTGNLPTEQVIRILREKKVPVSVNDTALQQALAGSVAVFG